MSDKFMDHNDCNWDYLEAGGDDPTHLPLMYMSKEWMIKLLTIWQKQFASMQAGMYGALMARGMTFEEAQEVTIDILTPMYTENMPLLKELSGIKPTNYIELNKIAGLSIDGNLTGKDTAFGDSMNFIDPYHAVSEVPHCPYLEQMEEMELPEEMQYALCHGIEEPLIRLVYMQNDPEVPHMEIIQHKGGPRKSKDELCCKWEFIVDRPEGE